MKLTKLLSTIALSISLPLALISSAVAEDAKADVEITIEGNDQMQFNTTAFEVKAGQTVSIVFHNVGKLPKAAMGHNLVILKEGITAASFAPGAAAAGLDNDYLPQDDASKEKMLAHTKLLGPDEKETITFTAPAAGEYEFVCTFPGHFAIMKGVMTVKE